MLAYLRTTVCQKASVQEISIIKQITKQLFKVVFFLVIGEIVVEDRFSKLLYSESVVRKYARAQFRRFWLQPFWSLDLLEAIQGIAFYVVLAFS